VRWQASRWQAVRRVVLALSVVGASPTAARAQPAQSAIFDEVCAIVQREFVDPDLNGLDWETECAAVPRVAAAAESPADLAPALNALLAKLETSHTAFYPRGGRPWRELLDIFHPDGVPQGFSGAIEPGSVEQVSLGVVTREIDGRIFAADVYPGSPAAAAGLLVGDEIVTVAGERWTDDMPLPGAAGPPLDLDGVRIEIAIRRAAGADPFALVATPDPINPREAFLRAQEGSMRIIEDDDARIGYIRVRSFAHSDYHEQLKGAIRFGPLAGADALILDLRGGWGGARPDYLDFLFDALPRWEVRGRGEDWRSIDMAWRKPLVVLIDEGTRSGKEMLAWMVRRHELATLVGARTAGAVSGGRLFPLADGSLLYLAVQEVLIDGERLEGAGVAPHIEVQFKLPYSAGADPQLETAAGEAAQQVQARPSSSR
jgi:carboxyl-terminal processing protease